MLTAGGVVGMLVVGVWLVMVGAALRKGGER